MQFVAEHAGRKLVRRETPVYSQATGEKIQTLPTVWIELERGSAPDWAVQQALARFTFQTRPRAGAIGGADVAVEQWCVYVDTEEWAERKGYDAAVREMADKVLSASPDMLRVEKPAPKAPWPNYDRLVAAGSRTDEKIAERNLETAGEIGVTAAELVEYERQTLNRPAVLAVYLEQVEEPADEAAVEVEA